MDGPQMEKLCKALCDVFDHKSLAQLLKFRLEKNLDEHVRPDGLFNVVFDLIQLASREGWLGDLILAAHEERPGDPTLQSFCSEHRQEVLVAKLGQVESKLDEVKKLQLEMAYQLNRDLLSKRFEAYGHLWSRMQATAIYTKKEFGPGEVSEFLETLSEWYFSATGGLFLTTRSRDFYFSLQAVLRSVDGLPAWKCGRRPTRPETLFAGLLKELELEDQDLQDQASLAQQHPELLDPVKWKQICAKVSARLESLVTEANATAGEVIYAAIQQIASVLRTNLVHELRSRLDVEWPAAQ